MCKRGEKARGKRRIKCIFYYLCKTTGQQFFMGTAA